ncbi:CS1 type fimbrial major subunit [Stenotrophomonas sp.]|uniref:CS1 type fimbrial major subunit n=1 Tax=Stenotrophomonas sp. TaxID=69392 RepID=UPI0029BE7E56|nr:CS1 type fimbrial major subunit [Stenotrophomonas sp.]MDX3934013.1 CS1 type fimbrial major subunit [Stenotrophomonas sp.]
MNNMAKLCLAAGLCAASVSVHAAEAHIIVWADVDPTLSLLKADGTALDDSVELVYMAGSGLRPWSEQVRIYTNDRLKDVEVRLGQAVELLPARIDGGAQPVPMTVKLNNRELTTTVTEFTAADLFPGSDAGDGASIAMPLVVGQTTPGPITVAGRYEGLVSIALNQKAAAP